MSIKKIWLIAAGNIFFLLVSTLGYFPVINCLSATQSQRSNLIIDRLEQREMWVQNEEGHTIIVLQEVKTKKPGYIIHHTIRYENQGDEEMVDVSFIEPILPGTSYMPQSAQGDDTEILFSLDGGNTFHAYPITYSSQNALGKFEEKEVPLDLYTNIQWRLKNPLPPRKSKQVSFKFMIK